MWKKFTRLLAAGGLAAAVALGCSSSNSGTCPVGFTCMMNGDGSVYHRFNDSGMQAAAPADGTTGKACTKDADCVTDGGPGINKCSIDYQFNDFGAPVQLFASPVCIVPIARGGNCDPAPPTDPIGNNLHFCDGNDASTSPGICVPFDFTNPLPNQGTCYPKCTYPADGSAATGCGPHNACVPLTTNGFGFCVSGCQTDTDCSALGTGYQCQLDTARCTKAPKTRTKVPGDACSTAGTVNDQTQGTCFCVTGSGMTGYCSSLCIVGGNPCPNGWTCDVGEASPMRVQTSGAIGVCTPACSLSDGGTTTVRDSGAAATTDAATDAAATTGACPAPTTCQFITLIGPDCQF
jgi:hypothetical protein